MEFRKTESFESGVEAVNAVDPQKLYPLLERTVTKLPLQEEVLTKEEMDQFVARFTLTTQEAERILRFCTFIFSKALETQSTEQALAISLKESGVAEQHCLAFATAWKREKDQVIKRVKKKNFSGPCTLESVDWKVHLEVKKGSAEEPSTTTAAEAKKPATTIIPKAVFQLELKDQSKAQDNMDMGNATTKTVSLEFDRSQLEQLYKNVEEIQSQLDALT